MKRVLKIIGSLLIVILIILALVPFVFQSQIEDVVKRYVNNSVNAQVDWDEVDLSFFKSFPKAQVDINGLVIHNNKPFEGETLATAKSISFSIPIKELLKKKENGAMTINSIKVDEALLTLKVDSFGNENFDIAKQNDTTKTPTEFAYDIKDYQINNSAFSYLDESQNLLINIADLNHSGKGNFSSNASELITESRANVSFSIDSTNYLDNNPVKLNATILMDSENQRYTFKENKGLINQLPLTFKGYVQQLENGQEIDISFENEESDFKSFLAIMPQQYSKNFNDVESTGEFKVVGNIKGMSTEERIPNIDIKIMSDNASFKYPNLPKKVENISMDVAILNTTGNADDTYIDIKNLDFKIDTDRFQTTAVLKDLSGNTIVDAHLNGTINLNNISQAYPVEFDQQLSGILRANVHTNFDMEAINRNAYDRIRNKGTVSITNLVFSPDGAPNPIQIDKAEMTLNSGNVTLNSFSSKTGQSDLNATGTIYNLVGFLLGKKGLQGNFNVNSNTLNVADLMVEDEPSTDPAETTNSNQKKAGTKIPEFLTCTLNVNANKVIYDDLVLSDVNGTLAVKDQQASLTNVTSKLFDGILAVAGNVSTKSDTPVFNMNIGAEGFNVEESFNNLKLLQNLAPIAKALHGKLNTTISIKGSLNDELSPNLQTISGSAFAELLTDVITPETSKVLQELGGALNFIDFTKLDLRDFKLNLDFSDGLVHVKPFNVNYKDIKIVASGSHSFDNTMDYKLTLNVPSKYLGSEVNRLIGKIDNNQVNNISIPVTAKLAGTFSNPRVSTDLSSSVSELTKQLIEIEKEKMINKGTDKIRELIGTMAKKGEQTEKPIEKPRDSIIRDSIPTMPFPTDTTSTTIKKAAEKSVKDVLGGLIKSRKTVKDSTSKN
ncbi:AsmA-like C-terminal region-containing protein [Aegicerativicinus sediminis]|uniref:AsmA-like C-terminal region-containing protein n=1 Tax=Aegicerativicinus sediminis TaxID=2893202 RepID=UPI001E55D9DB|nr:AsmA-like C-terminal region-containing protein [Aegicerativicinus sediminis]